MVTKNSRPLLTWQHIHLYYEHRLHAVLSTLHIHIFCSLCPKWPKRWVILNRSGMRCSGFCVPPQVPYYKVMCRRVCCIILYSDGFCWLRYWLMTHSLFNLLVLLQSRRQSPPARPTPERLPFPNIRGCTPLNWDPLCCDSVFAGLKMAGQVCKTFFAYLCPPRSTGQSGCEVDKFL